MTQGEILSSFVHIDTLIDMCEERSSESNYLTIVDLDYMEPFVTKAEEVAMKLSEYALEHFNSEDEQKRELADIICRQFSRHGFFVLSPDFKVNGDSYSPSEIRSLVYHIKKVKTIIQNTYDVCGQLSKAPEDDKTIVELKKHVEKLTAENERLKDQLEQKSSAVESEEELNVLKNEINQLRKKHEEMIMELLLPIFYNIEQDIREFLKVIANRRDSEITDTVVEWVKAQKISDKSKGRLLWTILHAAKYYNSTESNWNTAIRMRR